MNKKNYSLQAQLLISVLPYIAEEKIFALKGGTAINFFVRNFPRVSVDIDLTYTGFEGRQEAFSNINNALNRIVKKLKSDKFGVNIERNKSDMWKVQCFKQNAEIVIEVNYIVRGIVYPMQELQVCQKVSDLYGFAEMQVISNAELYGGKICAALDRQHPRDLFDIKILFENEGITDEIKNGFIVCMLSDNGAPYELLNPNIHNRQELLNSEFSGMTEIEFKYQDHEETLRKLIRTLHKSFTKADKEFILSFFSLQPKWNLIDISNLYKLPAVQWKIKNLEKMSKDKFEENLRKIKEALNV
ncbi:MAG: nucleotidyl transferase AbiEii/AbiGii toxin family protein [Endomicrobium sp.]|jgi:predicted nucleotidyltransferase component of viral defense system|nr:nucleotidyl transferase AbiEii/AbiGii toxin family protein [Endomicrobium sp.]